MADWDRISDRGSIEDRRGGRVLQAVGGIGVVGILMTAGISYLAGEDPTKILLQTLQQAQEISTPAPSSEDSGEFSGKDSYEIFASTVLGSNNKLWQEYFFQNKLSYTEPRLVLFRDSTTSACGGASSDHGPHYCPADETIYLDERFFEELTTNFGAKGGDVAEAYVIAHEVAHHVQQQLGIMENDENIFTSQEEKNKKSIRIELQADCLAGIWASTIAGKGILEAGEIKEALDAAAAVGDDRIQEAAYGEIRPETWTHGSSQERIQWFMRGYTDQKVSACNTST